MWWDWLLAIGLWILIIGYAILNIAMIIIDIVHIIDDGDYFVVFFIRIWNDTDFNILGKIITTLLMICFLPIVFIIEVLIILVVLICLFFDWLFHLKFPTIEFPIKISIKIPTKISIKISIKFPIKYFFQKKIFCIKQTISPINDGADSNVLRVRRRKGLNNEYE